MEFLGQKKGRLTVLNQAGMKMANKTSKYEQMHYLCQCDCGNQIEVSEPLLEYNLAKSCGQCH